MVKTKECIYIYEIIRGEDVSTDIINKEFIFRVISKVNLLNRIITAFRREETEGVAAQLSDSFFEERGKWKLFNHAFVISIDYIIVIVL